MGEKTREKLYENNHGKNNEGFQFGRGVLKILDITGLFLLLIAVLVYEYGLTHCTWMEHNILVLNIITVAIFIVLAIVIAVKKKGLYLLRSFVNAHHGESHHLLGLFNVVFVFAQLHLLGTEIHKMLVPHAEGVHLSPLNIVLQIIAYVALLFLPFLIAVLFIKPEKKVPREERKVLVTCVSLPDGEKIRKIIEGDFSKNVRDSEEGNLKPIRIAAEYFSSTGKVFLLIDSHAYKIIYDADRKINSQKPDNPEESVNRFFSNYLKSVRSTIDVELLCSENFNQMNSVFKDQKRVLEAKLFPYKSREIVFSLTSGTAAVTAALTLLSIGGQRGLCYLTQPRENEKIEEFEVSVIDLQDIITNYLSGHTA